MKIDFLNIAENKGISLRIIHKGQPGFAYTSELTQDAIDEVVESAFSMAQITTKDPYLCLSHFKGDYPEVSIYDENINGLSIEQKIEFALEMERAARSYASCVKKVRHSQYEDVNAQIFITNSNGLNFSYTRTLFGGSILAVAEEKNEAEMGWYYAFHPFFHALKPTDIGEEAAKLAVQALGGKPISTQKTPVIFKNQVMSEVLHILSPSFLADEVQKGKSLLANLLGEKAMSPLVNIYDDGLFPNGYGTRPCDDEGVPQRKNVLVKDGNIVGFLYDTYTAKKEDKYSTGNAGRNGIETPPKVAITNFYLEPLKKNFDDLLKELHKGLVVTDMLGLHTADPVSGDFSVGASGYWVERGERVFAVKGIAIAGNILNLFKNVISIGNDLIFFGHCGAPSVLIDGVQIGGV